MKQPSKELESMAILVAQRILDEAQSGWVEKKDVTSVYVEAVNILSLFMAKLKSELNTSLTELGR